MGIIDSNKFTLTCDPCGITEDIAVHQKGSAYSASWQEVPDLKHFDVKWSVDKSKGPVIDNAICRKCNCTAVVNQTA